MKWLYNMLKNTVLTTVTVFFTGIFIWVTGEAYFRVAYDVENYDPPTDWIEYHPALGWKMRPGSYSYFDVGAFTNVRVFVNELGIRNRPISLTVPPGTKRTTVLGDSFVFAAALSEGDKFTDRMQAFIGSDMEIVNVSVPAYGTGQEVLLLQDLVARGFHIGSKLVLVFFTNDVADNAGFDYGTLTKSAWKPAFHIDAQGVLKHSTPERIKKSASNLSIVHKSIFLQFLRNRGEIVISRFPVLIDLMAAFGYHTELGRLPGVIAGWYSEGWEQEWKRTEDIIIYLDKYLRQRQTELVVTIIPSPFQVESAFRTLIETQKDRDMRFDAFLADPDRPQHVLEEFCRRRSIRFVDTTSALRERNKAVPVYFLREGHLNHHGSEVVARLLHKAITAEQ